AERVGLAESLGGLVVLGPLEIRAPRVEERARHLVVAGLGRGLLGERRRSREGEEEEDRGKTHRTHGPFVFQTGGLGKTPCERSRGLLSWGRWKSVRGITIPSERCSVIGSGAGRSGASR